MKRSAIMFSIAALVIISTIIWLFNSEFNIVGIESLHIFVIVLLVIFAAYIGITRIKSLKRGEPADDELSKKMMIKASSLSYFISLYLWLVIMYIADKKQIESDILFGSGILGMGIIFAISWFVIKIVGLKYD